MTDYAARKALAEAATAGPWVAGHSFINPEGSVDAPAHTYAYHHNKEANAAYIAAANPAAVLALLADLDAARKADARYETLAAKMRYSHGQGFSEFGRAGAAMAEEFWADKLDAARTGAGA